MAKLQAPTYSFNKDSGLYKNTDENNNSVNFPLDIRNISSGIDKTSDFHVTALKNKFKDVARPNLFKIKIKPPTSLLNDFTHANNGLVIALAKKTSFPQIKIGEYVYERAGQKLHIPTNEVDYGELSITFINDSDFTIRSLFNRWQRLVLFNWFENVGTNVIESLSGEITVIQYDNQLNEVYAVTINNAWPQTVSSIELNQESNNSAEEFSVDFKFTMQEIFRLNK